MVEKEKIFEKLAKAIVAYDTDKALAAAKEAIEAKIDPLEAIQKGLAPGIKEVGDLFEKGEYALPFVMLSADAMEAATTYLKGYIPKDKIPAPLGTYVIGVVQGDIHDIGSKIVGTILESSGFKVYHIGRDIPLEKFIEEAEKVGADIIGASTLMTTTMIEQKFLVQEIEKRGLRRKYKVMIGGGPITASWCEEIGADAYAADAVSALEEAKRIMKSKNTTNTS
jgi:corrinoid protein of di/trimethylamine methyltransferase